MKLCLISRLPAAALSAVLILSGCGRVQVDVPSTVLPPAQMCSVLTDLHIVQASVVVKPVGDSLKPSWPDFAPVVLARHHTTQAQFDSSLAWYAYHPELLDSIYKQVITELSRLQGEAEAGRQDSLRSTLP